LAASEIRSTVLGTLNASGPIKDAVQEGLNKYVEPSAVQSLAGIGKLNSLVESIFDQAHKDGIFLNAPSVDATVKAALLEIVRVQTNEHGLAIGQVTEEDEENDGSEDTPGDDMDASADTATDTFPLGILASDHIGFVSFDLAGFVTYLKTVAAASNRVAAVKIYIYPNLLATKKTEVYSWTTTSGTVLPPLTRPFAAVPTVTTRAASSGLDRVLLFKHEMARVDAIRKSHVALRLPSLQKPSLIDWKTSPGSFAAVPQSLVGADGCETLTPANFAVSQYSLRQIFRVAPENPSKTGKWPRALIHEYTVSITPIGHSLGEILYTLPLAPGETTRLAIVDWNRNETSKRDENTTVNEQLIHEQSHDRSIQETVGVAFNEWQRGGSVMGGVSGGAGASGTMGAYGVAGGIMAAVGGGYTTSSGTRNLAANSMQNIADVVHQASSAVRELRSTVVVQTTQNEKETIQTKAFANHNRAHTLTIIYYEVLRHLRVEVKFEKKYDAILVSHVKDQDDLTKIEPPLWDSWADKVLDNERYLSPFLLDRNFAEGFSAIGRYLDLSADLLQFHEPMASSKNTDAPANDSNNGTGPTPATEPSRDIPLNETLQPATINFTRFIATFNIRDGSPNDWWIFYTARSKTPDSPVEETHRLAWAKLQNSTQEWGYDENINGAKLLTMKPDGENWPAAVISISSAIVKERPLYWEDLLYFTLAKKGTDAANFYSIQLEGISTNGNRYLLYKSPDNQIQKLEEENSTLCLPIIRPAPAANYNPSARQQISKEDYRLIGRFGNHIKRNGHYYNTVIANQRTDADWANTFAGLDWETTGGIKLSDVVLPTPLGILGDKIAFPLLAPLPTEPIVNGEEQDEIGDTVEHLISLPTRGVFAEAKLGHCNVAEEIDETRFWRWDEHPLPFVASDIAPAQPVTPQKTDPTAATQPTSFPQSIVNIQNPTALPDPTGLANALKVVGTPDIFRNMSASAEIQKLLHDLTEGAVSMAQAAGKAKEIQNKLETDKLNSQNETLKLNNEKDLGMAKIAADDRREAAEKVTPAQAAHTNKVVENAKNAGHISEEKASELIEKQLGNIVGNTKPTPKPKPRTFIITLHGKHGSMPASAIWGLATPSEEFGGRADAQPTVGLLNVLNITIDPKIDDPRFILNIDAKVTVPRSPFDDTWDINHPPGSPEDLARRTFEVAARGIELKIPEESLKRYDHHYVKLMIGNKPITVRAKDSEEAMEKVAVSVGVSADVIKAKTWGISGEGGFAWEREKKKTSEREIEMVVNVYDSSITEVVIN
tara:strand:- start:348 stop:4205 length:3858 start_codon:yes stop_codon:yes gene_type:complete